MQWAGYSHRDWPAQCKKRRLRMGRRRGQGKEKWGGYVYNMRESVHEAKWWTVKLLEWGSGVTWVEQTGKRSAGAPRRRRHLQPLYKSPISPIHSKNKSWRYVNFSNLTDCRRNYLPRLPRLQLYNFSFHSLSLLARKGYKETTKDLSDHQKLLAWKFG